jgi:hypoxanthine phosphoribosyltransferase
MAGAANDRRGEKHFNDERKRVRAKLKQRPQRAKKTKAKKSAASVSKRGMGGWHQDVERVLITEGQIEQRIKTLASEIERDFRGREMVVVSLLNGTVMFLADLMRHLNLPLRLDFMGVSSYGSGTESGELVFTKELRLDVRGRDLLLIDDILDTGKTLSKVLPKLRALKPRRIKICVLLDKPSRRVENIHANYAGFQIPDYFVVGYGLDFAERYRNLPFVGVLHPHVYKQGCKQIIRS